MWSWIIKERYKLYLIAIYNYFTILAKGFPLINGKMFQYKTWFTAFLVLNAMKMKIKSRFEAQRCWKQAHFNTSHQNRIIQELLCKTLAGYYRDNLAKNVQVSPPEPGWERQQAATLKCHWKISFIGLIVRTPIVDLIADTGQIYRNWYVSPRAFLHYFNENFNYFTQLPLKMNKNVCKQ